MTTATATFGWSIAQTYAAQSAYVNGVKNLLTSAGLVQTNDTGQINPTTDYIPSTVVNAVAVFGYLVYKFPDALQASSPIFVRVDFALSTGTQQPCVRWTVGTSTDGAGNIPGPSYVSDLASPGQAYTPGGQFPSYACYVDGTFSAVLGYGAIDGQLNNNCVAALVVDRARDAAGVAQPGAMLCESPAPFQTSAFSRSMYGPASPVRSANIPALIPSLQAVSSSDGINVNVFRHYMMAPGVKPSLGSLSYYYAEFGALSPIVATVLGAAHTYLPMGRALTQWSATAPLNPTAWRDHSGMIRWE